ncbi:MAG: Rieske (2Fe-2S) protein [Micromonosporaceae bacterium]|nr:Rieske (2Fe-2S) protein [Micromonosporaceae bacterium]
MSVNGGASRRAVLLGMGAVGAAGALAACGGDDPAPEQPAATGANGTTSTADEAPAAAGGGIPVARVPVGAGYIDFDRRVIVTQPEAGQFRAFDANCTHAHCMITWVEDGLITCPCHGSQFRIADGSVARGPATQALPSRNVTVAGDVLQVS